MSIEHSLFVIDESLMDENSSKEIYHGVNIRKIKRVPGHDKVGTIPPCIGLKWTCFNE